MVEDPEARQHPRVLASVVKTDGQTERILKTRG
jgi:hypothetical protein